MTEHVTAALTLAEEAVREHFRHGDWSGVILPEVSARLAVAAFVEGLATQGWELKPRKPSKAMQRACQDCASAWPLMFDAAPKVTIEVEQDQSVEDDVDAVLPNGSRFQVDFNDGVWRVSLGPHWQENEDLFLAMRRLAGILALAGKG
jgi:hypothetical protein